MKLLLKLLDGFGWRGFVGVFSLPVDLIFDFALDKGTCQTIRYFLQSGFLAGGFFYEIRYGLNPILNTLSKKAGLG